MLSTPVAITSRSLRTIDFRLSGTSPVTERVMMIYGNFLNYFLN